MDESLLSLVIVLVFAFLTPLVLDRFRISFMPIVIAEIIMGLIIGKSGFDLIRGGSWLDILSTLGFIFLMFLSGLEIDFSAFKTSNKKIKLPNGKQEPNRLAVSIVIFLGIFVLSIGLSYLFVWMGLIDNLFLMTLIISTISLGVVVPTLKEANIMKTGIGQIILLIAVIADLVTMILLAVFVSISGDGQGNMWLLLILFVAGILLYFVGRRFKNRSFIERLSTGTVQIGTRAIFTLIIVLVALSESLGAENILGAFLAGTLVSLLNPKPEMVRQLDSFGYGFLIPIFFVMVGVELDLWSLLSNKELLLLIPLLLIGLLVSKIVPVFILRKWYDTKTVLASSFLLTSTLSLVIAAAKIAERMNVITAEKSGTFILVAVITCIVTPIFFKKWFPKENGYEPKQKVTFIGANQMTLPVSKDLDKDLFEATVFHKKNDKPDSHISDTVFNVTELPNYEEEELENAGVFDTDILFISTGDEELNATLAIHAKELGIERVISRIESPDLASLLKEHDVEVFSTLLSTKAFITAVIESPNIADIFTNQETALYEIEMRNSNYHNMKLREFPFVGDIIVVRIFRDNESLVPHGDTRLKTEDRLIVTGTKEFVDDLMRELQF
ncbi:monovalent cation:proton antiporter family protein [Lederbergia sp. NSJ-179]|uniref:monovalent cation:proton antiporter family protein n=1 Tax=Lederbergia sp. NSJ-179 TaxID=2931402 RepID=UPI001FD2BDAB|nr:monovalent cation:proton antiporter family protein [Lederbergia sp. NSJ-179]MCJ7840348.1 monovalent cation:proton antiporter family protein [Lederbergia sp. NSJ-179]